MSMMYCDKHDRHFDSDYDLECSDCERPLAYTTYIYVNDNVRVATINDDDAGTITHRLESKLFNKWTPQNVITTYFNVP